MFTNIYTALPAWLHFAAVRVEANGESGVKTVPPQTWKRCAAPNPVRSMPFHIQKQALALVAFFSFLFLTSRKKDNQLVPRRRGERFLHEEIRQQWWRGDAVQEEGGRGRAGHRGEAPDVRGKTNSLTTSLSPKCDEWTSWDFIWIRNEALQGKAIGHHFLHSGRAMNRPKEHHLLSLILYCIPPVTLKASIALLPGMNQDMGSPTLPRVGVSGRKMNCTIRPPQQSRGILMALISLHWFCSAGCGRSHFIGLGYYVETCLRSTVCLPRIGLKI